MRHRKSSISSSSGIGRTTYRPGLFGARAVTSNSFSPGIEPRNSSPLKSTIIDGRVFLCMCDSNHAAKVVLPLPVRPITDTLSVAPGILNSLVLGSAIGQKLAISTHNHWASVNSWPGYILVERRRDGQIRAWLWRDRTRGRNLFLPTSARDRNAYTRHIECASNHDKRRNIDRFLGRAQFVVTQNLIGCESDAFSIIAIHFKLRNFLRQDTVKANKQPGKRAYIQRCFLRCCSWLSSAFSWCAAASGSTTSVSVASDTISCVSVSCVCKPVNVAWIDDNCSVVTNIEAAKLLRLISSVDNLWFASSRHAACSTSISRTVAAASISASAATVSAKATAAAAVSTAASATISVASSCASATASAASTAAATVSSISFVPEFYIISRCWLSIRRRNDASRIRTRFSRICIRSDASPGSISVRVSEISDGDA